MSGLFEELLRVRGVDAGFLCPEYEDSVDPFLLPDMDKAVERVKKAAQSKEKVLIYGDYDVDGVTASAALYDTLKLAGVTRADIMLPNRFLDGYGMSKKVVQKAAEEGVNLVFTVDCGSRNHEIIKELAENGVETVVTDHHECGWGDAVSVGSSKPTAAWENGGPRAVAVVNPKRKDLECPAELKNLAGVGVVFKLAQALVKSGMIREGQEKWLLDLTMIGTICDSMVLTGENRRICYYGRKVIEKTRRQGLKELLKAAGVKKLSGDAIGYQIGPRLNAAGRMETAEKALGLLMAGSRPEAAKRASELEELNKKRKTQQQTALDEIRERGIGNDPVIVVQGDWHEGVLGIIAGRLVEEYRRPAFVLAEAKGFLKGSGRSFGDFNLAAALDVCREYLVGGGGHAEACGVTIERDNFERFREAVNQYYENLKLENQERFLEVKEDLEVRDFGELTLELIEEMRKLEPYGTGNEEPVFLLPEVRVVEAAKLGSEGQHLRLTVWDQNGRNLKLMCFSAPERYLRLRGGELVNVWVTLGENEFRGLRSVEGRILKLRFAD